ncbi:MAG: DUF6159 family protein [Verrucomicrobiota bacterium]
MFATLSRSWQFAKISYRTLFENKQLLAFPAISTVASILVFASFLLPLWQTGQLDAWFDDVEAGTSQQDYGMYVTAFLFYFCNYFVIIFFNTALVASVMNIFEGGQGKVGFGLSFAAKRLHSIFGWALVSAVIGTILRVIERNQKAGAFIAAIIGSAWTALSYFVIPVIASQGLGPIGAFKESVRTLKSTWGTALAGNFSMGGIGFLISLPVILLIVALFIINQPALALGLGIPLLILVAVITATADYIFKAYLFTYATGKALPDNIDTSMMGEAFRQTR